MLVQWSDEVDSLATQHTRSWRGSIDLGHLWLGRLGELGVSPTSRREAAGGGGTRRIGGRARWRHATICFSARWQASAGLRARRPKWQKSVAGKLSGQGGAGEFLGHLVRAVQDRNSLARGAARQVCRPGI